MQIKPITVKQIEIITTPFCFNVLTNLLLAKLEIIVHKEMIKVKKPCNELDTFKDWYIAGQLDPINESGKPNEINIKYITNNSKIDIK